MPDNVKNENAVNTKKTPKMADFSTRVSLVELIMILMLVGLVFVFYFGMKQLQIDKANEAIAQEKFENIIPTFKNIIEAMETYRKADEFGDYPAFLEELNIQLILIQSQQLLNLLLEKQELRLSTIFPIKALQLKTLYPIKNLP